MLDAWSLRVLVEVGERGSFSAAADALSMTQPAVSRQIGALERRLGVSLFRRVPRGITPTAAGTLAIEEALGILDRMRTMEAKVGAYSGLESGQVRLSAFPSANTAFVPEAIRTFSTAHPGVEVSLVREEPAAIHNGRLDIALVTSWDEVGGLNLVPLLDEKLHIAMPARHPLARRAKVPLGELLHETWIEGAHPDCLGPIPQLAEALGGAPHIGFICDDWNGKQALVANGMGITLIPTMAAAAARPDIVIRPTIPTLPSRRVFAAAAPAKHRTSATTAMLAVLTDLAARYRTPR